MGDYRILLVAGSVLLVTTMVLAGCVQDNGNSTQVGGGQAPSPAGTPPQYNGTRFQLNLTAAAEKLGVTQQQLEAALNMTSHGRMNLTSAAEQLGVTGQQLADALGFRFNASIQRAGSRNDTLIPRRVQQ
jgi:hypothetical protein